MTDHPRFRHEKGELQAACRDHHRGELVALVLRLVERGRPASDADCNPMLALDRAFKGTGGPTDSRVEASTRSGER